MFVAAQKSPEAFRTISEVAEELDVPQHVLRFWETRFVAVKPLKRGGGRRYYRPEDVDLLRGIRALLYSDGLTIKGVQKVLRQHGARYVIELGRGASSHLERMGGGASPFGATAADLASNVRLFPKAGAKAEAKADWGLRAHFGAVSEDDLFAAEFASSEDYDGHAPAQSLKPEARTRLRDLLDELLELKARLRAAKRKSGFR